MNLLTPALHFVLRANAVSAHIAAAKDEDFDPVPVVKLFNPLGAATWLATELYDDGDTLFGLADLGFGCPELGVFSLSEIASVRLPFGLGIERDLGFSTPCRLSVWADTAHRSGAILFAETLLRRATQGADGPELPTVPGDPDGG